MQKKSVLIVEDDVAIGAILTEILEDENYCTVWVKSGEEALDIIESFTPGLFLFDYRLPGIDGLTLYDKLCEQVPLKSVPIIVVSANIPKEEIAQRGAIGIPKPFDCDTLLRTIEATII